MKTRNARREALVNRAAFIFADVQVAKALYGDSVDPEAQALVADSIDRANQELERLEPHTLISSLRVAGRIIGAIEENAGTSIENLNKPVGTLDR